MTDTTRAPAVDRAAEEGPAALEAALLQAARDMHDLLVDQAAQTEAHTYYSEEIHQRFLANGLYRMYIPKKHGGLEATPRMFYKVAVELARADMSAAWCFALSANHGLMLANWFPEEIHADVFAGGGYRAAAMYAPTVTAKPADDGWELDGVVGYCSGIPYSTHFIGSARLPGTNDDGSPRFGIYLAPKSQFTRLDDWGHTLGLKGSGSHSIRFEGGRIPATHMVEDEDMNFYGIEGHSPGSLAYGNPMYSGRHTSTFTLTLAALTVGGAYNALEEYENIMRTRKTTIPPFVPRTEDPDFQAWYGSAFLKIGLLEAALDNIADQWLDLTRTNVSGERPFTSADDLRIAGIAREIMIQAWETVEQDLYRSVGSSASKNGERFERIFRDLAQAAGHRNPQLRTFMFRNVAQQQLALSDSDAS